MLSFLFRESHSPDPERRKSAQDAAKFVTKLSAGILFGPAASVGIHLAETISEASKEPKRRGKD